jgi:hypothetical protein
MSGGLGQEWPTPHSWEKDEKEGAIYMYCISFNKIINKNLVFDI